MWRMMTLCEKPLELVSYLLIFTITVQCVQFNITIDDQDGDPTNGEKIVYTPGASWNIGQDCSGCHLKPPETDAFDGTWMDSTYWNTSDTNPEAGHIVQASVGFKGAQTYIQIF